MIFAVTWNSCHIFEFCTYVFKSRIVKLFFSKYKSDIVFHKCICGSFHHNREKLESPITLCTLVYNWRRCMMSWNQLFGPGQQVLASRQKLRATTPAYVFRWCCSVWPDTKIENFNLYFFFQYFFQQILFSCFICVKLKKLLWTIQPTTYVKINGRIIRQFGFKSFSS